MRGKLGDKVRLQHFLDAIHEIEKYLTGTISLPLMKTQ
jgi:hypothetical protein